MKRIALALIAAALAAFPYPAHAQNNFPTPGGSTAPGAVTMCNNGSGLYIPCAPGGGSGGGASGGGPITPVTLVPAVPASIPATTGTYISNCATLALNSRIDFSATLSQPGTLKINRYLNTTCSIPVDANPVQGAAAAATPAAIAASDGAPAQSYRVEIDNTSGSASNITNAIVILTATTAITGSPTYNDANGNLVQPVVPLCNGVACGQLNPAYTVFAAGEFHVGEFGSNQTSITSPMTTSANTVTTGKSIGGLQTLANAVRVSAAAGNPGTSGNVLSTIVSFVDPIGVVPFDVFYFQANPTGSTCTDNTAFALVAADRDKVFGIAHVTDINSAGIAQLIGPPIPFTTNNSTSIFACVVVRGSATITGTANASLDVRILRQ